MKKILSLVLVIAMLSLSALALASCDNTPADTTTGATTTVAPTTSLSVAGKSYQMGPMTLEWADDATAENKTATLASIKMMLGEEGAALTEEADILSAFEASYNQMAPSGTQVIAFAANGTVTVTMTEEGQEPEIESYTYTQDGATVTIVDGTETIELVSTGDSVIMSRPMGSMFAGLNAAVAYTVVAD